MAEPLLLQAACENGRFDVDRSFGNLNKLCAQSCHHALRGKTTSNPRDRFCVHDMSYRGIGTQVGTGPVRMTSAFGPIKLLSTADFVPSPPVYVP